MLDAYVEQTARTYDAAMRFASTASQQNLAEVFQSR